MPTGCIAHLSWLAAVMAVCGQAATFSNCDVNHAGRTTVADVQKVVNEALGTASPANDLNRDGVVNVVDVQIDIDAALGLGCVADPSLTSIVPNNGQQGVSGIEVTISGHLTSFTNSSSISLGAGITVTNVVATNAATLTAALSIAANAATGSRTLTVDGLTLANAFTVTVPVSVSYTYDSQNRISTATYTSPSGATTTITYTYDAAGNRTAVVGQ
jgi:YD repeat-containing protein